MIKIQAKKKKLMKISGTKYVKKEVKEENDKDNVPIKK